MSRVCIIGIDGLDPHLVDNWIMDLPNLSALIKKGNKVISKSVFPVDSVPAWVSIYTGLNPAEHGIVYSSDYLELQKKKSDFDITSIQGKTFWDKASEMGKKVCVINPFLAYPAWRVNGVMVSGPVFQGGAISSYPEEIVSKYRVPPLGGIVDFPTKKTLQKFCDDTSNLTEEQAEFGLKLFEDCEWDIYFISFLTLDRLKHFLWRYVDENDPTYVKKSKYKNSIKELYKLFDRIIGEYNKRLDKDDTMVILSDHGHGMRATKVFHVNEFLRQKGYLPTKMSGLGYILEKMKILALKFFYYTGLEEIGSLFQQYVPFKKKLKDSSYIMKASGRTAYAPYFAGLNPYGGINVNKDDDYEQNRSRIIAELKKFEFVKFAKTREEMYRGKHIDKYPDVLFRLKDEYGVSPTMYTGRLTGINLMHKRISGGHKEGGVFIASELPSLPAGDISIMDIRSIILHMVGVNDENTSDK